MRQRLFGERDGGPTRATCKGEISRLHTNVYNYDSLKMVSGKVNLDLGGIVLGMSSLSRSLSLKSNLFIGYSHTDFEGFKERIKIKGLRGVNMRENGEDEAVGLRDREIKGFEGVNMVENGEDEGVGFYKGQGGVEMGEEEYVYVPVIERGSSNMGESESSEDLVQENGGPSSAVDEGSLGVKVKENSVAEVKEKGGEEEDVGGANKAGDSSEMVVESVCDMEERESSGDLVQENGGPSSAVDEDSLGVGVKESCVSSSVEGAKEKGVEEEDAGVANKAGDSSEMVIESGCNMGESGSSGDLMQENGGPSSAVDGDSLGVGVKEKCVSSSVEEVKEKGGEEEGLGCANEAGDGSEKVNSGVVNQGRKQPIRTAALKARELIRPDDEDDDDTSRRGKGSRVFKRRKKNGDGIAEMVNVETKQRRSSRNKAASGECSSEAKSTRVMSRNEEVCDI